MAVLGDESAEKLGPGWRRNPLEKQLLMHSNQGETKPKPNCEEGRWKKKKEKICFVFEVAGASQMFHPSISTSTGPFVLGVDFIPQQMDGRIRSSPHYTPLLRSL